MCPMKIIRLEMRIAAPFLGHFRSLESVRDGTEGIAQAKKSGPRGNRKKPKNPNPNIEMLSITEVFAMNTSSISRVSSTRT